MRMPYRVVSVATDEGSDLVLAGFRYETEAREYLVARDARCHNEHLRLVGPRNEVMLDSQKRYPHCQSCGWSGDVEGYCLTDGYCDTCRDLPYNQERYL